jgi:WD40 repeat protein
MKELGKIESDRYLSAAELSPDGKFLAAATRAKEVAKKEALDWNVTVWDLQTYKPKHVFTDIAYRSEVQCLRFSPDGKKLAHSSYGPKGKPERNAIFKGGQAAEYDLDSGRLSRIIQTGSGGPAVLQFDYFPDGKAFCFRGANNDRTVWAYDFATEKHRPIFKLEDDRSGRIRHAMISNDQKWLVVGIDDRDLRDGTRATPSIIIWDLEQNKIHDKWLVPEAGRYMLSLAVSRNKKTIAVGSSGLYLFELSGK